MKPAPVGGVPYRVPPEPNRWSAIALAAAVHAVLLLALFIGVSWQNTEPVAVEAEVWDMKTQSAAPPPPPPPQAEPEVRTPPPPPAPTPAPRVIEPPVERPVAPKPPDIALEREKERKAEKLKQEREDKRLADAAKAKEKKAQELADKKAQEADKKARELADKKAQELADKKLAAKEAAAKLKADKLAEARAAADEQKKLDKLRAEEMRRITGGAGTAGSAPKSTAPRIDTGYLASITSKIKNSTTYAGDTDIPGNPRAVFKIEELPTGEIISVRKIKSSGVPAFDDAVEKGIIKSSPLPKKKDGTVERTLEIGFSMKDLD